MDINNVVVAPIWRDETAGISNVEKLYLPSDRKWKTCHLKISTARMSFLGKAKFNLVVQIGNRAERINIMLSANQTRYFAYKVEAIATINVVGRMSVIGLPPARGSIELSATYETIAYQTKSVSWRDRTGDNAFFNIDKLAIPAQNQAWSHCEIRVDADKNSTTEVTLSLLVNGTLWDHLPYY